MYLNISLILPRFDEQYVDYGMNKLIWIFRLRMQDYQFKVLLHSFCVHVPHPTYSKKGMIDVGHHCQVI